jgi:hypothetical protein
LVKNRGDLYKLQVEELKDKDKLFAYGIHDELVLRSEYLFEGELLSLLY